MRTTLSRSLTIAAACGAVLLFPAARCPAADEAKPKALCVVRTWGDLLAQTPVSLPVSESGSSPAPSWRLGIDSTDGKLYGGVVLYCLQQGGDAPANLGDRSLGAFLVQIQSSATQTYAAEKTVTITSNEPATVASGGALLYMKIIPLTQPGDYTITVKMPAGKTGDAANQVLAATTINVSGEEKTIWTPWPLNTAKGAVGLLAKDDAPGCTSIGVANPDTGLAEPRPPLLQPIAVGKLPNAKLPLPQLFPTIPDDGLKLTAARSLLIATMDEGIEPQYPDEKFLTRWWINGKPFVPKSAPMPVSNQYFMRHNGALALEEFAKEVCFQVEFHPEILGAKKGDVIGVQLLLCPAGWSYSGPVPEMQQIALAEEPKQAPADAEHIQIARLSNRVNFVYSGDPASMADPAPVVDSSPHSADSASPGR